MNVVSDAISKPLRLEIFQAAARRRSHYQIGAFCIGAHPEKKRTIPGDESVGNQALGICLRFIPNILRVERKRYGEIADLDFMRRRVFQKDRPRQSVVLKAKRFAGLQVFCRHDFSAFAVDTPPVETGGRALLQLDLDTESGGSDGSEIDVVELVCRGRITVGRAYFFPVFAIAVEKTPALGQLSWVSVFLMKSPVDLNRADFLGLWKIVLHPFRGS